MLYLWYTFNPLSDFPYLIVKHKVELVFFFFIFFLLLYGRNTYIFFFIRWKQKSVPKTKQINTTRCLFGCVSFVFNTVLCVFRLLLAILWCSKVPVRSVHKASIKMDSWSVSVPCNSSIRELAPLLG